MSESTARLTALLLADAPLVLQRVARSTQPEAVALALAGATGKPAFVATDVALAPGRIRVLDARNWPDGAFSEWDTDREHLATAESPLVVLLLVHSATALLRVAPHVASWAGGVWMPEAPAIRVAETPEELDVGRRAFHRALAEDPSIAQRWGGRLVAVDLLTGRVFGPRADATALDVAVEHLDEGTLYLTRITE